MTPLHRFVSAAALSAALLFVPLAAFQEGTSKDPAPSPRAGGGGGLFQFGSSPQVIKKVEPEYDLAAKEAKIEGEVWLSVVIDENGVPTEIREIRSVHPGLTVKAIEAVSQWRFKQGVKDGHNVAVRATIAVAFKLNMLPPKIDPKYLPKN